MVMVPVVPAALWRIPGSVQIISEQKGGMAINAPHGFRSAAGVHVSTFVAPQFDDINPTGWPVVRCRSRPKNQQTALKWPGQPPPMEEGEATAHGCSTQPKSLWLANRVS